MSENLQPKKDNGSDSLAKFENKIRAIDPKIFEGIDSKKKQELVSVVMSLTKTHIGPLPDPETLAEYSAIIPNGAERIMTMAEKQSNHRMDLERRVVKGQMFQSNLGQFLAFLIGMTVLIISGYCALKGMQVFGSILGVGGLTSLVTAFIKGKQEQKTSLEEKKVGSKNKKSVK